MAADTIDAVIAQLEQIIQEARTRRDRIGFFATLYRTVKIRVRDRIHEGNFFADSQRMERLAVNFSNRYLDALALFRRNLQPTQCHLIAFQTASRQSPIILQHLLLGINAHINLDLPVAVAQTIPGIDPESELLNLKPDFDKINQILGEVMDKIENQIAEVSPFFGLIDIVAGTIDEKILNLGLIADRELAWQTANLLAFTKRADRPQFIKFVDDKFQALARQISDPGPPWPSVIAVIRKKESDDIPTVMQALNVVEDT